MQYIYIQMDYHSAIKRMSSVISNKMDGPRDYHTK